MCQDKDEKVLHGKISVIWRNRKRFFIQCDGCGQEYLLYLSNLRIELGGEKLRGVRLQLNDRMVFTLYPSDDPRFERKFGHETTFESGLELKQRIRTSSSFRQTRHDPQSRSA